MHLGFRWAGEAFSSDKHLLRCPTAPPISLSNLPRCGHVRYGKPGGQSRQKAMKRMARPCNYCTLVTKCVIDRTPVSGPLPEPQGSRTFFTV
jgi:hypothetical protein